MSDGKVDAYSEEEKKEEYSSSFKGPCSPSWKDNLMASLSPDSDYGFDNSSFLFEEQKEEATEEEKAAYKKMLRRQKRSVLKKKKKNKSKKVPLLFPIIEKTDWMVPDKEPDVENEIEEKFEIVGTYDVAEYKDTIKKSHKTYSERLIGQHTDTDFILSLKKLSSLINDVQFLKENYEEVKELSNE